jgi:hypothetical protein
VPSQQSANALSAIPAGLRDPLLREYQSILQNYFEQRWAPSELSGGRFAEIAYSIIDGLGSGVFARKPSKPKDMVTACRKLEQYTGLNRGLRILIPRVLPALYEVRNNRNVGHVGGEVDPNHMDATFIVSTANWIMAELVRVLHSVSIDEAQKLVDSLAERTIPIIWQSDKVRRVLDPQLSLKDQALLLIASSPTGVKVDDLFVWLEYKNRQYFTKLLNELHNKKRFIEYDKDANTVQILPPGDAYVASVISRFRKT